MLKQYFFVKYLTEDRNIELGMRKGHIVEITPPRKNETNRGSKEGSWLGFTKMPADTVLWNRLITGQCIIDVDNTTTEKISILDKPDVQRAKATSLGFMNTTEWGVSSFAQKPGSGKIYYDYLHTYLKEFTRLTNHIPVDYRLNLYPHALLFPCSAQIFVGRDGLAIAYTSPNRPEQVDVLVDTNKLLDELLLPHASNNEYSSFGPESEMRFICDDEHYLIINNVSNGYAYKNYFGNPQFVITEKRYHGFWKNILFRREYLDKSFVEKYFQFVEFYGDISSSNFTIEKAKSRAISFVKSFASFNISSGSTKDITKIINTVSEFKLLINNTTTDEHTIENFIDENPWIIERSLGYKKYYSQIKIDKVLLSRSENDIRPDKFMERNDGYCDILDLKRPDAKIIIKKRNRNHASAAVIEAESQVANYVDFCCEPLVRQELNKKNINILWPQGLIVIGRILQKDRDVWEDIKKRLSVKVYIYDDLVINLEVLLKWFDEINTRETK